MRFRNQAFESLGRASPYFTRRPDGCRSVVDDKGKTI